MLPTLGWKPPAGHGVHFDWPATENDPMAHMPLHSGVVDAELPYRPGGQDLHPAAPLPPYFPLSHMPLQPRPAAPAWPKRPGGQMVPRRSRKRSRYRAVASRAWCERSEGNAHTSRSSEQVGSPLRTSAGTSQRVPPGWALLAHPACLVLDEPPAGTRCACCDAPAHHGGLACFHGRTRDARSGGIAEFASGASPAPSLA